ncbi:ChbG/HpnK family deacetylase [bacterium]|nr:ChbG/HpnK family deacetylase [bacterium]
MKLIINADDFGLSKSISDGIISGIEERYITSTSIMANMKYAEYAIKQAILHDINCIGLHINLTVGKPIKANANLTDENGIFYYNRKQIDNEGLTYQDAYNEIMAQIEKIDSYSNGKIKIDHLDTHHHLWDNKNIKQAIIDISNKLNIPIRNEDVTNIKCPDILYKDFTINNVNIDNLKEMVSKYKDKDIIVELMTHSGFIDEYTKSVTSYLNREEELKVLKEAKKIGLFDGIKLINFSEF